MDSINLSDKNLRFDYTDLCRGITDDVFTIRDVLSACATSKIGIDTLSKMFHLNLLDFHYEMINKPANAEMETDIDYMEISCYIESAKYGGLSYNFSGIGKPGHYGKEIESHIPEDERSTYIEHYAIGLTPIYKICDIPIKINHTIKIDRYFEEDENGEYLYKKFPKGDKSLVPEYKCEYMNLKLFDVLYVILREIGFYGNPSNRDGVLGGLNDQVDEIKEAEKNGTLDTVCREINLDKYK